MGEIDGLYKRMIRQVHPDAGPPEQQGLRNILSQQINEARKKEDIELLRRLSAEVEALAVGNIGDGSEIHEDLTGAPPADPDLADTPQSDPDLADSHPPEPESTDHLARRSGRFGFARFDRSLILRRDFQVRVAIALVLVLVSLFTNRQFLGWGLLAVLAVLVVPYGRARSLLGAFVPYALIWFIFTFLRSLADETQWAQIVNTRVTELERWLFNGELPTIRMQADWYTPGSLQWYDYYFTFIHWSYFLLPHAVAVYLWWKRPEVFRQLLLGLGILLTLGLGLYFLLPSNPPWMAPESVNSPGAPTVLRIMEPIGRQLGGGLYQAGYNVVGESNPIAAMPSIHFAVTFLFVFVAMDYAREWRIAAWVYNISMGLALIYMGEHYVVDILAGAAVTAVGWVAAGKWLGSGHSFLPSWRTGETVERVAEWPPPRSRERQPATE